MEKITCVYQTDVGTRIEFEGDAWTIEDPITCLMASDGRVFFIATEERGERTAKAAFMAYGRELTATPIREFPENDYVEVAGWALGVVASALGGWETIWATFETALYPDA